MNLFKNNKIKLPFSPSETKGLYSKQRWEIKAVSSLKWYLKESGAMK